MADNGVTCSMSRSGNVWDNAVAESFFSSLKIERAKRKVYRTRDQARADVFDYIERFYNLTRRHSTIGYLSLMQYEERAMKAYVAVHETGSSSFARQMHQAPCYARYAGKGARSCSSISLRSIAAVIDD